MPNLKSLKALKKLIETAKPDLVSAGLVGTGVAGGAGLLSVAKNLEDRTKALTNPLGQTGDIETRPTADIAKRLDVLKDYYPESRTLYRDLESELKFRKIKDALVNKLKNKPEDNIE